MKREVLPPGEPPDLSAGGSKRPAPARTVRLFHPLDVLLLGAPVALLAEVLHWGGVAIFFASGLAIVPLARYIGIATEELARYVGPAASGLLGEFCAPPLSYR